MTNIVKQRIIPSANDIQYREFKILIKASKLKHTNAVVDFWNIVVPVAKNLKIDINKKATIGIPNIREVLFYDTPDFKLYQNSYILRSRRFFINGIAQKKVELTIKFRDKDFDKVSQTGLDVIERLNPRIKYKDVLLPLKERLGGMRSIYAKQVIANVPFVPRITSAKHAMEYLPALHNTAILPTEEIKVVNDFAVEELFGSPGVLDFGNGVVSSTTLALWRDRHWQDPLVGEFAFQVKAQRVADIPKEQIYKMEEFYKQIQIAAHDWIEQKGTKTSLVYGANVKHNE